MQIPNQNNVGWVEAKAETQQSKPNHRQGGLTAYLAIM